jgi:hypothetical protein
MRQFLSMTDLIFSRPHIKNQPSSVSKRFGDPQHVPRAVLTGGSISDAGHTQVLKEYLPLSLKGVDRGSQDVAVAIVEGGLIECC